MDDSSRAHARGRLAAVAAMAVGVLGLCSVFAAASAAAAASHNFSLAFGGAGTVAGEAGSLSLAPAQSGSGVAVNSTAHDVYVADTGNRRVDEFTEKGEFVRAWGWGVATGAHELQVCELTCQPGVSGSEPGEFERPTYIAVDNANESASKGDVYVADIPDDIITKFDSEGNLLSSWGTNGQLTGTPTEPFNSKFAGLPIVGIAVDDAGQLWVYNKHGVLFRFNDEATSPVTCTGVPEGAVGQGGIAVDASHVYVHEGFGQISALTHPPSCTSPGRITSGASLAEEPAQGIAIGPEGDFYVVREESLIEDIPASCVPSKAGCPALQAIGANHLEEATGIAVSSNGTIFAASRGSDQIVEFKNTLEANISPPSNISGHEATLHGTVNPEGAQIESCEFEIGLTTSYGTQFPCTQTPSEIGHGESPVPVSVVVKNLSGDLTYHFRLHVRRKNGTVYTPDETVTTLPTAAVIAVSSEPSTSSATLMAVINPQGLAAEFHFEYGPCEALGRCAGSAFPNQTPVESIASGSSPISKSQTASGPFMVGVTYHFRVVVKDANGVAIPSPEGTFTMEPQAPGCTVTPPRLPIASPLADCRAYELVSPPAKNGALIDNGVFIEDPSVAPDGSRVITMSLQCFHDSQSCTAIRQTEGSPYLFARGTADWETESLMPSAAATTTVLATDAASDTALLARSPEPSELEQLYAREPDGTLRPIGPIGETPGVHIGSLAQVRRLGTEDLSHVVFEGTKLWPSLEGKTTSGEGLYAYPGANGAPMLVGVTGGTGSTSLIGTCGISLGGTKPIHSSYGSLSADGRATFFTVLTCPAGGTGANKGIAVPADTLYQRVETGSGMKTVLVSGPGPEGVCGSECQNETPRDASFQGASTDGSRVFFTDTQRLTDDASNDQRRQDSAFSPGCSQIPSLASGCNLYEFACPAHCEDTSQRVLVDASSGDISGLGPRVQGVMAIPPDGSDVFFVAQGVLTSSPNAMGQSPSPGGDNLYAYRFGTGGNEGSVRFVARLSDADSAEWTGGASIANVSAHGEVLVFTSHRALTADVTREEGPAQVYRYDVTTERLTRVSIGQGGFNDNGNACQLNTAKTECKSGEDAQIALAFHGWESGLGPGRSDPTMSDDGNLVFFESPAGLTPGALNYHTVIGNEKVLANNVYEWAAFGTQPSPESPACAEANGCVSLISDGHDVNESTGAHENNHSAVQLLGVDSTGENVFFWTADPLLARDKDSQVDLYDARVGGGFPEPLEPEPCPDLETCHGKPPSSSPGVFGPLATASFSGSGNAPAAAENAGRPVVGPSTRRLAPAQQLAVALKACASKRGRVRTDCEQRARGVYRGQLLAAGLEACRRKHGRVRAACEHRVRKLYGRTARGGHR